jgi:hypothetical protein
MPKTTGLFSAYPSSSYLMRGQTKITSDSLFLAFKKFAIYKDGGKWKAKPHRPNIMDDLTLKVPKSLLTAKKHYVFRFDVNEVQGTAECNRIGAFTEAEWALEFMNTGEVKCEGLCSHNLECRQLRAKIVDKSLYWEVGYFTITRKRLIFSQHTYRYQAPRVEKIE